MQAAFGEDNEAEVSASFGPFVGLLGEDCADESDVYDASGNLLLAKDSTAGTTLFLGRPSCTWQAGATTASAVRTYTANGVPVAERSTVAGVSGSTVTWLGADAQGTVDLQMTVATGAFGVRLQDPSGNARGTSTTTWGDGHGFLNATTDALSGLVQLGARMYDATIGRFLSVDSVLKPSDPQQNNGYSYAHNTPIDLADPNGLDPAEYWDPATAPKTPYLPPGSKAPAAAGNSSGQSKIGNLWSKAQGAWYDNTGFRWSANGIVRSQANPLQLLGGYNPLYDMAFWLGTGGNEDAYQFQFVHGHKSYDIWVWKGEYLTEGDGAEGGTYVSNAPLSDNLFSSSFFWNSDTHDSNRPLMSVSLQIVSQAVVVAFGVAADGRLEVLGFDVGDTENETFWTEFLRSLKTRGLDGVKLVISDAHTGWKKAISTVFQGAAWQRCRVHFMRNDLAVVPKASGEMVASIIRTIFAQPDNEHVSKQFGEVTTMLARSHPKVAVMLSDAQADLLAFAGFPTRHWRQIWSTNPLERINKEIKRRTDVVGVFPNPAALLRLAGVALIEQHDEWEAGERRYFSEASMLQLKTMNQPADPVDEAVILPN